MSCLDERLEHEIISLARRFGLSKVILFGSRARCTNRERSDIDLAVSGGRVDDFTAAVEELETLLTFDVVNLDSELADDLQAELARDGLILYKETPAVMKKLSSFDKSLTVLLSSKRDFDDEIYRMGIIGQFNLTFELAWKALREVLLIHGISKAATGSPREILKAGYEFNFFDDEATWLDMLKRRNQTIHLYDEGLALELVNRIFDKYMLAFSNLREELTRRLPLDD